MKKLLHIFLFLNLSFLFSCGSSPETHYYLIEFPISIESPLTAKYPITLALERFQAVPLYEDDRIIYRESKYEVKFYNYRRWVSPPTKIVTEKFLEQLKISGLFKNVVRYPYASQANYLLRGTVKAFEEWDEKEKWFGKVVLEISLEKLENHELIWQGVLSKTTPAEKRHPREIVEALSVSLQACIDEFLKIIDLELGKISR